METSDVPAPGAAETPGLAPLPMSVAKQLFFYDPASWEEFVREWVTALQEQYVQVKRIGGSGDGGADIAAFLTEDGFEGAWDSYQCKHYGNPLAWSDVLPEFIKVFRHAAAGDYLLPRKYVLVAPKGASSTLHRLLSSPSKLRTKFLTDAGKKLSERPEPDSKAILDLASSDAFTRFVSAEPAEYIDLHRQTPYHALRFGTPLPNRTIHGETPDTIDARESRYLDQLVAVYGERWPDLTSRELALLDDRTREHLTKQRFRFYEAESLHAYARDNVPEGTFEKFQQSVLDGIVDVVGDDHPSGWSRLNRALTTAGTLNLTSHPLIKVAGVEDLKGVCHQLANDDLVQWMPA